MKLFITKKPSFWMGPIFNRRQTMSRRINLTTTNLTTYFFILVVHTQKIRMVNISFMKNERYLLTCALRLLNSKTTLITHVLKSLTCGHGLFTHNKFTAHFS